MRYFGFETTRPLQYMVCGQLIDKTGFLHHRRNFDQHVFILVTEGTLHITVAQKEYNVGPNQYIFLKAGEEHFGHKASKGTLSYFWVHFAPQSLIEIKDFDETLQSAQKKEISPSYRFPEYGEMDSPYRARRMFLQMIDLSLEENLFEWEMFHYMGTLLMMEVSRDFQHDRQMADGIGPAGKKLPAVIGEAKAWIRENYCRPFKVTELASVLGYQADYLSTLFKQSMGLSIVGYTNKIRIEAAKNLLETEGLSIKVVAYSCGFTDEKYFMKVFKKMEGSTPGQYKGTS